MEPAAGVDRLLLHADLLAASATLGVAVSDHQAGQLLDYLDLLGRWNRTYNLTSIRDTRGMLTHHLIDCLAVVAPLRRELGRRLSGSVLDVGSGGGLPGVVIAVMVPTLRVTCVDAVGKKTAFIRQAGTALRLANLDAVHARVENVSGFFDVVTSRAFASLVDFTTATCHLLAVNGIWMAMKGKRPDDEMSALPTDIEVFHVEPLNLSTDIGDRCVVWMKSRKPQ